MKRIGVDIGGTKIASAVFDPAGTTVIYDKIVRGANGATLPWPS